MTCCRPHVEPSTSIGRRYIAECAGHRRMNASFDVYAFTGCRRVKDQLENFRYLPWSFAPRQKPLGQMPSRTKTPCATYTVLSTDGSLRYFWPFYPNVTTLRSGLSYRKSVCLSVICLYSVTFVRRTHGIEPSGNISSPLYTTAIL